MNISNLTETKNVIKKLIAKVPQAESFLHDEEFLIGLTEEISEAFKDTSLKTPKALFEIVESGKVIFVGIVDEIKENASLVSIPLVNPLQEKTVDIENLADIFQLLSSIKESYNKETKKIYENLDQISQVFDKVLVDTVLKQAKNNSTSIKKEAREYLDLDISLKKQKLLEKLLK